MRFSFIFALILLPFLSFGQVTKELSDLTNQWSEAISNQDLRTISGMYAENIVTYGKTTTRKGMLRAKFDFYLKYPNFSQSIVSAVRLDRVNENQFECRFTKQYRLTDKVLEVVASLYFSNTSGSWKIVKETDDITEKNIKPKDAVNTKITTQNPPTDVEKKRALLKELLE
jgi:hypothetical protein